MELNGIQKGGWRSAEPSTIPAVVPPLEYFHPPNTLQWYRCTRQQRGVMEKLYIGSFGSSSMGEKVNGGGEVEGKTE